MSITPTIGKSFGPRNAWYRKIFSVTGKIMIAARGAVLPISSNKPPINSVTLSSGNKYTDAIRPLIKVVCAGVISGAFGIILRK